jgi:hypothetical protein
MLARFRTALVIVVLTSMVFSTTGVFAQGQTPGVTAAANKATQLLQASGYTFTTHTPIVWSVIRPGSSLKSIKVVISVSESLLVVFVTVVPKARMRMTPEFMHALLKFNYSLDRVKVGFDDDGDLCVRSDTSIRLTDVQEFKVIVEQVAAASNEVYEGVSAYILPN